MGILDLFKKKEEGKVKVNDYKAFDIVKDVKGDYSGFEKKLLNHSTVMLITGRRGSGKTALGMKFLELFKEKTRKRCLAMGFSDAKLPWKIKKIADLEAAPKNSVVLIDEGAVTFSSRDSMKDSNKLLGKIMAVARHKNLSLILIVQNSAMIDLNVLRLADSLILKEPSLLQTEFERAPIKKIYSQVIPHFEELKEKQKHFYVWDDDFQGLMKYDLPNFWNDNISKSFRNF
ncbi:MAG: zonular occludens toxin domain-containing protein [Nanoarchaeota archaeon]|nr:zonular occludens toxin domain-containing protein [Nanoarchaeota archaeon]